MSWNYRLAKVFYPHENPALSCVLYRMLEIYYEHESPHAIWAWGEVGDISGESPKELRGFIETLLKDFDLCKENILTFVMENDKLVRRDFTENELKLIKEYEDKWS